MMDTIVTTDGSHKLTFLNETVSKDEASNPGKEYGVVHCEAIDGKNHSLPTVKVKPKILFSCSGTIIKTIKISKTQSTIKD